MRGLTAIERNRNILGFALFVLLALSLLRFYLTLKGIPVHMGTDFSGMYNVTRAELWQGTMYQVTPWHYPPISLVIMTAPFTLLDLHTAWIYFSMFNLAMLALCIFLAMKLLETYLLRSADVLEKAIVAVMFLGFGATYATIEWGQNNFIILALILASWYTFKKGRGLLSGALLATATILKVIPGVLLAYFIWKREKSVCIGSIATLILFAIPSLMLFGLPFHVQFFERLFKAMQGYPHFAFAIHSYIQGFLPQYAQPLVILYISSVLLILVYATRNKLTSVYQFDREFPLVLIAMMLLSSFMEPSYLVWFIPAFIVLIFTETDGWMLALYGLVYAFLAVGWHKIMFIILPLWITLIGKYMIGQLR